MKLKIAIVVQGRFHAFDLARALLLRGHDVTLFTNYPKWAVKRFDFPDSRVSGAVPTQESASVSSTTTARRRLPSFSNSDRRLEQSPGKRRPGSVTPMPALLDFSTSLPAKPITLRLPWVTRKEQP